MSDEKYSPPKVWTWDQESGGKFANINRPISGATHDKDLPVGKHPMQLYSLGTPNGVKVTVLLEELLALGHEGAEYDAYLINIGNGDQFGSGFVEINPNSKIPALLDRSSEPHTRVLNPVQFWFILLKSLVSLFQLILLQEQSACLGFFGKWVVLHTWVEGLDTFMPMLQKNLNIPSIVLLWKLSANWMSWIKI